MDEMQKGNGKNSKITRKIKGKIKRDGYGVVAVS